MRTEGGTFENLNFLGFTMGPSPRPSLGQRSAVAVLVTINNDEESLWRCGRPQGQVKREDLGKTRVLVSKRIQDQGQLALPGGKVDAGDASLAHAAARELEEETGLVFPACAFTIEHTLNEPDWIITLLSVRCPIEKRREVRNLEPEKHGPWAWRTWEDLQVEPANKVFAPLRRMLQDIKTLK
jgi:8-oxo-dGTP pyrophosphatase MutT (NUDIX family)